MEEGGGGREESGGEGERKGRKGVSKFVCAVKWDSGVPDNETQLSISCVVGSIARVDYYMSLVCHFTGPMIAYCGGIEF